LGERLDLPASAITESVIEERLRPAGMDAELLKDIASLFQVCNQARYAPKATQKEFADIVTKTKHALLGLEKFNG
jgi:hypothetical protein